MNNSFLEKITNESLEDLLINKENIPKIEHLLLREYYKFAKLKDLEKNQGLNFGDQLKIKEVKEIFPKIREEVNEFLGVDMETAPEINYYKTFSLENRHQIMGYGLGAMSAMIGVDAILNGQAIGFLNILGGYALIEINKHISTLMKGNHYQPKLKRIRLEKMQRSNLIPIIAHEYTHFVQDEKILPDQRRKKGEREYGVFGEGHARGVEREISNKYMGEESNPSFIWNNLNWTVGELYGSYKWVCSRLGIKPDERLVDSKSLMDKGESLHLRIKGKPTLHSRGNTLFLLNELTKGNSIYKELAQGNFVLS